MVLMSEYWDRLTKITKDNKKRAVKESRDGEKFSDSIFADIKNLKPVEE